MIGGMNAPRPPEPGKVLLQFSRVFDVFREPLIIAPRQDEFWKARWLIKKNGL